VELSSKYALFKVQQPTGTLLFVDGHAQVTHTETTLEE
jgi:prepilin-type processing-associated H-X9-DG protein